MPANEQSLQTHTFNPANDIEIIQWLVQDNPDELPPTFPSFKLSPAQLSMGMSWIIVFLANLACDFEPKLHKDANSDRSLCDALSVTFTEQEHLRFQKLQNEYHNVRFHHLTKRLGYDANTASSTMGGTLNSKGLFQPPHLLTLSPRMMIENDTERTSMKTVLIEYLNRRAQEAEMSLLRDLEADARKLDRKVSKKKKKKLKQQNQQKENQPGKDSNAEEEHPDESKKRVRFHEQSIDDEKHDIEPQEVDRENATGKDVHRTDLRVEIPKSNDILAHLMVPLKIDYEDRVAETFLRTDVRTQSKIELMTLSKEDHAKCEVSSLMLENESLKAENAQLRREFEAARQKSTEAIQRVQLKAYIAETARDSAQERAALLEALLVEVIDGKIAGSELEELFLNLKTPTPTAASSLSSLLDRLPKDTIIRINSSQGDHQREIQHELQNYKGVLSRLRRGDNIETALSS
ncbi:hypothetical protein HJC23_003092 [Cyclotella cryptica]|uniref:Uncharacterized protein n=1 Tax=Cyclotella cryptica TaxID=29204 RepID=A0ABD3P4L1_9STRA|eukprot:CCRYP_017664-RA/>CCRYP_017664-RA protein AED:0.09 eAED:0.09 QI:0/-1/0/1/-1/1/1/0/462